MARATGLDESRARSIEWIDSHGGRGWQDLGQIEAAAALLHVRSVGWLVTESDECKVIVPHTFG